MILGNDPRIPRNGTKVSLFAIYLLDVSVYYLKIPYGIRVLFMSIYVYKFAMNIL